MYYLMQGTRNFTKAKKEGKKERGIGGYKDVRVQGRGQKASGFQTTKTSHKELRTQAKNRESIEHNRSL